MRDNAKGGALTEVTFYILLSLYTPKHGYAVMQFIEEKTDGRLSLGAGTLYGALNSLQDKKEHPLRQLFWECTLRCNLHCRPCPSVNRGEDLPQAP